MTIAEPAEAMSEAYRQHMGGVQNNLMTRKNSPSIVIVCATPWHGRCTGRILAEMESNPDFRGSSIDFSGTDTKYDYLLPSYTARSGIGTHGQCW